MAGKRDGLTESERIFLRMSKLQTVIAAAGIVTAVIALYAALNESDAVRKQQEASVWPMVQISVADFDPDTKERILVIEARNAGIGPARIEAFRFRLGGVAQKNFDAAVMGLAGSYRSVVKSYVNGRVISPGEEVVLMSASGEEAAAATEKLYDPANPVSMDWSVCYCSVFDSCWEAHGVHGGARVEAPVAVRKCPDYGNEQFEG